MRGTRCFAPSFILFSTVVTYRLASLQQESVSGVIVRKEEERTYGFNHIGKSLRTCAPKKTSIVNLILTSKYSSSLHNGAPTKARFVILQTILKILSIFTGVHESVLAGM